MKNKSKVKRILFKALVGYLFFCWFCFAILSVARCYEIKYAYPLKYKETIIENSDYYSLDRTLIFAVIKTESGFNPMAKSKAGAMGLMQITKRKQPMQKASVFLFL